MIRITDPIAKRLIHKLSRCSDVWSIFGFTEGDGWYTSKNPGIEIYFRLIGRPRVLPMDFDLTTGKSYYRVGSDNSLPDSVSHIFDWYKDEINGGEIMSKKEINEAIRDDIQTLASDLTKKREMDKADSSAEDIAKKLGVKLPKSTK